jgi:hypothetical protein
MTNQAPASFSISAEMSPVCAPEAAVWQSWPPIATTDPRARVANDATSVAGGQINRSALPASGSDTAMIACSSAADADSPFIFQLPAISGRPLRAAMVSPVNNWQCRG